MMCKKYKQFRLDIGDEILLYGKKKTVLGFKVQFNEWTDEYSILLLTEGRGDPLVRTFPFIQPYKPTESDHLKQ